MSISLPIQTNGRVPVNGVHWNGMALVSEQSFTRQG